MRVLALETSETAGSVAALEDDRLLSQIVLDPQCRSAQTLAQGLQALWNQVGWRPADVQLVGVTAGPGSFTGLRVGVTTAKVLAYAIGAEVLGVDTLEVIAQGMPSEIRRVAVAVDAQRGQVVGQSFQRSDCQSDRRSDSGWFVPLDEPRLLDLTQWLADSPGDARVAGPILRKLPPDTIARLPIAPPESWFPLAQWVGVIAWRRYQAGQRSSPWTLVPHYSRVPAAEEKWRQRQAQDA